MSQGVLRLGWGREGTLSSALGWVACVVALFSPLQFSVWPCSEAPPGWPSDHTTDCPKQRAQRMAELMSVCKVCVTTGENAVARV